MQNFSMSIWTVWLLIGIAVPAFLYVSRVMIRDRWTKWHHAERGSTSGATVRRSLMLALPHNGLKDGRGLASF
jgi:hypothetical protein